MQPLAYKSGKNALRRDVGLLRGLFVRVPLPRARVRSIYINLSRFLHFSSMGERREA